jgi:hypothetical protein
MDFKSVIFCVHGAAVILFNIWAAIALSLVWVDMPMGDLCDTYKSCMIYLYFIVLGSLIAICGIIAAIYWSIRRCLPTQE